MGMKQTSLLKLIFDIRLKELDLMINPNDGFDLGLMTTDYQIDWCPDADPDSLEKATPIGSGRIYLKNEIANNTMIISSKWENRFPRRTGRLLYNKGKIGFSND